MPSPETEPSPGIEKRRGRVVVEAALVVEFAVEFDAPDDDEQAAAVARKRALSGPARREWDLIALSAARALRRHLLASGRVASLTVARATADEPVEMLVRSDDGR